MGSMAEFLNKLIIGGNTMSFNFHNKDRLNNLLDELKELRYRNLQDIESFEWFQDDGETAKRNPEGESETVGIGFRWKGWDQYNWLCTHISIPEELKDEEVIGLFDFGVPEGDGNNSHFESLLFLNGESYQGMDGNHKEVFLEPRENGLELDLKFRVWSGLSGGGVPKDMAMEIERAQFGVLDQATDDLYYLARNVLETYVLLDENNEHKKWMLNELVQAFCLIDYSDPRSDEFYASVEAAFDYLDNKMDGRGKPDVSVSMLGHTHIDVAWLWRLRHTREKVARSFSTVNRLMDKYDHYTFLQSQAQLYEYVKEDYPDIYAQIQQRVKEKRWEPAGGMWVECDCNLASGESLVRQILVGKNFFKEEFDYESEYLWLPDVFGYSWAMPQILKKSGINTFMTTKISWNDTNKMPYDTFTWRGMDGSEITSHFITTTEEEDDYYTYNGDSRPYAVKGVWDNYSNKDTNKDLLISYGYGDGGGGPNRDMLKTISTLNQLPGIPKVKVEHGTDYFRRLNETLEKNEMNGYLPTWDGELYLEFHRGTYTSQAYSKRTNRKLENYLRDVEIWAVMANKLADVSYKREDILKAWKIVLCHQFHDILPGTSIKEVYEDSHVEYGKAQALLDQVLEEAQASLLTQESGVYTVFNNSNWVRDSYISIHDIEEDEQLLDESGSPLKMALEDGVATVLVKDMAPLSFTTLKKVKNQAAQISASTVTKQVETSYYKITWNESGHLTSMYDKEAQREILPEGTCGNVLQVFEDKPRCFDAWELEPTIDLKMEEVTGLKDVQVTKNGLGTFVDFTWEYKKSTINQTMCLYDEKKRIDFKTEIDWQERQKFVKVAFPVNVRAVDARFDIQYGNIKRPITSNSSWEAAKFEVVAHKWVDLAETGYGVALLNDCKYGYDVKENVMRLSLLKSSIEPDYEADIGQHIFTYAILPHTSEWYDADVEQEAFDLNNPITAIAGQCKLMDGSMFTFDQENVALDCVKLGEYSDLMIVRFHEFMGKRSEVRVGSNMPIESWYECNLMEEAMEDAKQTPITMKIKPYEIKTIAIKLK